MATEKKGIRIDAKLLREEIINFGKKNFWYYVSFQISTLGTIILRPGNIKDLKWWGWVIIFVLPFCLTVINYQIKKKELKKVRSELDFQYKVAFKLAGKAILDFYMIFSKKSKERTPFLRQLLGYVERSVESVLEENEIEVGHLSANLMKIEEGELRILEFALEMPDRLHISLPLNDEPLPGAPEAYKTGDIVYIKNTNAKNVSKYFHNKEYQSFFSFPIIENENDGQILSILNVDSRRVNQFKSKEFISDKIYPAIIPLISIIKLLHKMKKI